MPKVWSRQCKVGPVLRPTFAARLVTLEFERLTSKGREKIRARLTPRKGIPSRDDQRDSLPSLCFPIFLSFTYLTRVRGRTLSNTCICIRALFPLLLHSRSCHCDLTRVVSRVQSFIVRFIPGVPPLPHQCLIPLICLGLYDLKCN